MHFAACRLATNVAQPSNSIPREGFRGHELSVHPAVKEPSHLAVSSALPVSGVPGPAIRPSTWSPAVEAASNSKKLSCALLKLNHAFNLSCYLAPAFPVREVLDILLHTHQTGYCNEQSSKWSGKLVGRSQGDGLPGA